jgi:hypothetical protein
VLDDVRSDLRVAHDAPCTIRDPIRWSIIRHGSTIGTNGWLPVTVFAGRGS